MTRRIDRVNGVLRQEISRVLLTEMRDPRLSSMISITRIQTSSDMRQAKVYVSVLGGDEEKKRAVDALKSAAGFIHRAIRDKLDMKNVPHLYFYLDDSIERGNDILELIDRAASEYSSTSQETGK